MDLASVIYPGNVNQDRQVCRRFCEAPKVGGAKRMPSKMVMQSGNFLPEIAKQIRKEKPIAKAPSW
jgi:hypothetical protein